MKKEYIAPEIELIRFESEEVLNALIISGVGNDDAPTAGDFDFGDGSVGGLF